MEKVVDNEELMQATRGNPVIYVRSSKDFEIAWKKKKCMERNNLCTGNRYCISPSTKLLKTNFMKQATSIWNKEETPKLSV